MSSILLATNVGELARRIRVATGDDLTVLRPVQVPTGPAQLLGLSANPDGVRAVVLDVRTEQVPVDQALHLAGRFEQQFPYVAVVLVTDRPAELGLAALRAGVHDILDPDSTVEEFRIVLRRAQESRLRRETQGEGPSGGAGRVIGVASPKGGVGKTTVATNIALALAAQSPQGTVLVDLDVQFGDVAAALDLEPTYTLADMTGGVDLTDAFGIKALLTSHRTGLQVVCGVKSPVDADKVSPAAVHHLMEMLKSDFRYVVIDTAPGLGEEALTALDHVTDLVLVTSLDVPGVRGLRKELDVLDDLDLPPSTRHIVVNMADKGGGLSVADVEATIGRSVDLTLGRHLEVVRSTNQGSPIVESQPRHRIAKEILQFVERFAPLPTKRGGLYGRHRGRIQP